MDLVHLAKKLARFKTTTDTLLEKGKLISDQEASPGKAEGSEPPEPAPCTRTFCSPGPGAPASLLQATREEDALSLDSQTSEAI